MKRSVTLALLGLPLLAQAAVAFDLESAGP